MPEESGWYFCIATSGSQTLEVGFQVQVDPRDDGVHPVQVDTRHDGVHPVQVDPRHDGGHPVQVDSRYDGVHLQTPTPAPFKLGNGLSGLQQQTTTTQSTAAPQQVSRPNFQVYRSFGENTMRLSDLEAIKQQTTKQIHHALVPVLRQLGDLYARISTLEQKTRDL